MSDLDQLIAAISGYTSHQTKEIQDSCHKTLEDYQAIDTTETGDGYPLRMIAWDSKCSN